MSRTKQKGAAEPMARTTKIDTVVALLRRPAGADVGAMMEATGWQAHSVRGAIAGNIKKKLGLAVTSTKVDGKTVYRVES